MTVKLLPNPRRNDQVPDAGLAPESREPWRTHATLPGYATTPLVSCDALARRLGVGHVLVKDEASRLGLPSFKILGASWAVLRAVADAWGSPVGDGPVTLEGVRGSIGSSTGRGLVAATDGNHGRGVARMASLLGLECVILVPNGTAAARISAIEGEGADVRVVAGTYDDAIAASALLADADHLVISDTSWPGYDETPRHVVEGYSTMFFEIDDEIAARGLPAPTHVLLQAGVGAFAAAGLRHYRSGATDAEPFVLIVEPTSANCLMASAEAGELVAVPGPHDSSMAGLNCGLPSTLVWPLIEAGADAFVAIEDVWAEEAMRAYASEGVVAGESGAAGLGGLLALVDDPALSSALTSPLGPGACVLLLNTEGATDPANYDAVLGAGLTPTS
jgi:diaminopropionate ammonia-lyase